MSWTAVGSGFNSGGPTSATITKPAGTTTGDLIVIFASTESSTGAATSSGFTQIGDKASTLQGFRVTALYKVAGASEPASYTVSGASGTNFLALAIIVRRSSTGLAATPIDASSSNANTSNGTAVSVSGVTTTATDELIFSAVNWNGNESFSTPSGFTAAGADTPNGNYLFSEDQASAGATGTVSSTLSASDAWIAWLIAIAPAGGGGALTWTASDSESDTDSPAYTASYSATTDTQSLHEAGAFAYAPVFPADAETLSDSLSTTLTFAPSPHDSQTVAESIAETFAYSAGDTQQHSDGHTGALTPTWNDTQQNTDSLSVPKLTYAPPTDAQALGENALEQFAWTPSHDAQNTADTWSAVLGGLFWTAADSQQQTSESVTWTLIPALADAQSVNDGQNITLTFAPPADTQQATDAWAMPAFSYMPVGDIQAQVDALLATLEWLPTDDAQSNSDSGALTLGTSSAYHSPTAVTVRRAGYLSATTTIRPSAPTASTAIATEPTATTVKV